MGLLAELSEQDREICQMVAVTRTGPSFERVAVGDRNVRRCARDANALGPFAWTARRAKRTRPRDFLDSGGTTYGGPLGASGRRGSEAEVVSHGKKTIKKISAFKSAIKK